MASKRIPKSDVLRAVSLLLATLTFLVAIGAIAQVPQASQPNAQPGRSTRGNTLSSSSNSSLFLPVVTYGTGMAALAVAIADVNGDGKPDVIVSGCIAPNCAGAVAVLLGNGDGTLQTPGVTYDSGGYLPYSVALADVNGDGKPDVIVANTCAGSLNCGFSHGNVGVLLGNGDGTFQPVVTYDSGGAFTNSVAVADVNGDGKPDIVVVNSNEAAHGVAVLLGNGDGTFQPALTYYSNGPWSVAVADVNGDGKPDLIVATFCFAGCSDGSVDVLLGNGDGTFRPRRSYDSGGFSAHSVAVADVNGDGKPDLIVGNESATNHPAGSDGRVSVLLGNGDGTFRAPRSYDSGGWKVNSVAVADVNGDGKPDVIVINFCTGYPCGNGGNYAKVGVLLNNGDGTFQQVVTYSSGGLFAYSVVAADLRGNGTPDLTLASGSLGVLLNNSGPHKATTTTALASSLNPSIYGQAVTWRATVTTSGSITPTGKVRFTWSGYTIGSATLNSSGVATLTRSNLNADAYPLTAVYAGDAANLGSTSPVLNQVVLETTSTATLTSSPNPSTQVQAVTFTAKISSPTVTPTGPVTFTSGKTVLGTGQLSGGKAKLVISSLPVGSTKVTVTYYGDSNIAKSSASVIQTVQ
jgi:Bacterial Ig-like domain (group 3)/FG-GAP-like repeat